ncbi:MAG TPA: hypothetical protein VMX94_10960 [Armatimonadota bacterium]|nr:hypothetical protein [Armatimonadota bacterium]
MESRDPVRCEWCKRELPRAVRPTAAPTEAPEPAPRRAENGERVSPFGLYIYEASRFAPSPEAFPSALAGAEANRAETLIDFFVYAGAVFLLGSSLIAWRYGSPYLLATIACMFLAGILLARFNAVPAFEEGWEEFGVPLMLMLAVFFPMLLVFLGYVAYGAITHRTDRTVVRLLSPHFVAVLTLMLVSNVVGPEAVPIRMYGQFRGVELLSLSAILLGWSATSWRRLLSGG